MSQSDGGFYPRVFALAAAALLAWALLRILQPFVGPILWALLLAFLLFPLNRWLRGRLRGRRGAAALLLTLGVTLGIVAPAAFMAVEFAGQASDLVARLNAAADRYQIVQPSDVFQIPFVQGALRSIEQKVPVTAEQVQKWVVDGLKNGLQFALSNSRGFLLGALGAFVGLALTLFLLYFFFRDGDRFAERIIRLIPADAQRKRRLTDHLSSVANAVVLGSLLTAVAQGALIGLSFWISGLPSPVVFGVLAAVCALLPVGGTAFVWVPGAIGLAVEGRWGWAIFVAVWGALVVGSADNLLRPLLISGRAEISTLPVFIGVLGGLAAFGPIGMFLGPVMIALVLALLRFVEEAQAAGGE